MRKTTKTRIILNKGFTLIEVLVSVVLFSVGLLGVAALQYKASQKSVDSEFMFTASLLANDLATAMYTNGNVVLPAATLTNWENKVAGKSPYVRVLPNATGTVVVNGNAATITITWTPPDKNGHQASSYFTEVQIPQ